jgi:penicillin-binding protein 1A
MLKDLKKSWQRIKESGSKREKYAFIGILGLFSIIILGLLIVPIHLYLSTLPSIRAFEDYRPGIITELYDRNGQLIGQFAEERRKLIALTSIPQHMIDATIAIEDSRFYHHCGLDFPGIMRAFWVNMKARRIVEGGSTITQQLSKLLFLTPEKTITRKIKEAVLALQIEHRYAKDEILELYFNQIYFGHGAYGIEAAANTYFGKHAQELTLAEAALLAGLPRSPLHYSPYNNPELALRRRTHALRRMVKEGFITEETFLQTKEEPLELKRLTTGQNEAPYFVEHIRRLLEKEYGTHAIYRGGLRVYTTLDLEMQKIAQKAVQEGLRKVNKTFGWWKPAKAREEDITFFAKEKKSRILALLQEDEVYPGIVVKVTNTFALVDLGGGLTGTLPSRNIAWTGFKYTSTVLNPKDKIEVKVVKLDRDKEEITLALEQRPKVQGALVALEPSTGYIRAMVGGYDFEDSEFNRATQAKRQPGSAFKPFIYTAAIDNGYPPTYIIIDAPVIYDDWEEKWTPKNYDEKFRGPTTLRVGLAQSRNVVTVKLLQKVGVRKVINYAHRMGIKSDLGPDLSLALGTSEVIPLELAEAYAVLPNQGITTESISILKIEDRNGNILEENFPEEKEVLNPASCYIMTNLLRGVVEHGTCWRARAVGHPCAAKTGTTDDCTDAWFIGFTADLVTCVWVGFDEKVSLGKDMTGSRAAGPIWADFMKKVYRDKPVREFPIPEKGLTFGRVCPESGLLATKECPQVTVEAFLEGTEPKDYCDLHGLEKTPGKGWGLKLIEPQRKRDLESPFSLELLPLEDAEVELVPYRPLSTTEEETTISEDVDSEEPIDDSQVVETE